MTLSDFELLVTQARLAADAKAIAVGHRAAAASDIASSIRGSLSQAGWLPGDLDAVPLNQFANGGIDLRQLWEVLESRR